MSEYQEDAQEDSSDLEDETEFQDEEAESSAALDEDQETESSEEVEDDETIGVFESDKANKRFSEITAKAKQAEADAAANRAENEALRRRIDAMETGAVPAFNDTGSPNIDDYDSYEDHQTAVIAYESGKAAHNILAQQRTANQQANERAKTATMYDDHNRKRAALAATVPTLGESLARSQLNNQTQGGNATAEAILRSMNGAEIEYHIAENPDIAVRLNNMDQYSAYGEVARISESLKVKPRQGAVLPKPIGASPSGGSRSTRSKAVYSKGATFK